MSAIWGIVNFDKKAVDKEKARIMKECFDGCAIDRFEEMFDNNVYMGCGIQYVTNESKYEKAPTKDETCNFVSDSIVDNREELCDKLSIKNEDTVSDGEILEKMVAMFGTKANDYIRGVYAFVKYNKETNEVVFAGDPLGQRTVYYMVQGNTLYFASLMKPLKLLCNELKPNDKWLSRCIIQYSYGMHTEEEQLPYEGIFRIAPATRIRAYYAFETVELEKTVYWDPCAKRRKIKYKSDAEYMEHFRKLYADCVNCVLRSSGETAILLSGGYDSSSVGAWASKELERRGKNLYSFTSVPMDGYVNEEGKNTRPDETNDILAMAEMYKNIVPTFMKLPDMDIWAERKDYMNMLEMPYKSPENLLWMYKGEQLAREKGARILLTGGMGNATVSFGNYEPYLRKLIFSFRWIKYLVEIENLHRVRGASRKNLLKYGWDTLFKKRSEDNSLDAFYEKTFVNENYAKEHGANDYLFNECKNAVKLQKNFRFYYDAFFTYERMRTTGDVIQHTSLQTGVITRDPTKDVRMIEFCRSIPQSQYTKKGQRRRLITVYMKDMIPEQILTASQGIQSADVKMRIIAQKEQILQDWINNYERFLDNPRINCKIALEDIKGKDLKEMSSFELVRHIYTNVFLEFLEKEFS